MVILFDLDGTLTDPFEGITRCVQYALSHFGIQEPDLRRLAPYIGPPLKGSFMQRHGLSDEQAEEALRQYRVRFSDVGMFENRVYEGIPRALAALREAGHRLGVATSKPTVFSAKILEHFGLASYFDAVVGSELDGRRVEKAEVIAEAMDRLGATPEETWMVGDRYFDMQGAHQCGVRALGVTWGYAEGDELAGETTVDTVEQLAAFFTRPFGLQPADLLLPRGDLSRWAVVACDQFTSQPEYWQEVEKTVGEAPSALRVTLPEVYLTEDPAPRIAAVNETMKKYLTGDVFRSVPGGMVYVERQTSDGVRRGLLGIIDLDEYEYLPGSHSLIRATEQTVVERIPPRVTIRRDAPLELPHVLLLADDPDDTLIGPLTARAGEFETLYDFDLMMGGGHITGRLPDKKAMAGVQKAIDSLLAGQADPLLFAVGDGNHSLASAKECRRQDPTPRNRYALVEVVNLQDPAIRFEPIYRVVFQADVDDLLAALPLGEGQPVTVVTAGGERQVTLRPSSKLPVGTVQAFLDGYIAAHPGVTVDYIHGEEALRTLAARPGAVGFLFQGMGKEDLFPAIRADGSLPRKTFSMGHAEDKRYYVEARLIK